MTPNHGRQLRVLVLLAMGLASCNAVPAAQAPPDKDDAPRHSLTEKPTATRLHALGSEPARPHGAASEMPFTGVWVVQWCEEPAVPGRPCGGFRAYLSQIGNRVCGTYGGADQRADRLDEGAPRSIIGTVVDSTAVLAITSERSQGIYLATAELDGDAIAWEIAGVVKDGTSGEPALIADGDRLTKSASADDVRYLSEVVRDCASEGVER